MKEADSIVLNPCLILIRFVKIMISFKEHVSLLTFQEFKLMTRVDLDVHSGCGPEPSILELFSTYDFSLTKIRPGILKLNKILGHPPL